MRRDSSGFSFIEVLIGVVILVLGLVPLVLVYSMSNKETRVSTQQVQAIHHSANLLEAFRSFGTADFKNLVNFPRAMEQRYGGDNQWTPTAPKLLKDGPAQPGTTGSTPPPSTSGSIGTGDPGTFDAFKKQFFDGQDPVVPKLDKNFKRAFEVLMVRPGYITIVVRTTWEDLDLGNRSTAFKERSVEFRTVVADPFMFTDTGPSDGEPGTTDDTRLVPPGGTVARAGTSSQPAAPRTNNANPMSRTALGRLMQGQPQPTGGATQGQ